ncbi:hypothetical protein BP1258A_4038 [Burkholderia pseudomallei 1258a]|uniref:hypothetical protein n=1 Tax=Burkholderia pseudomallei TaxID=28450 RepID=UPI00025C2EFF|nr:hypothetical protein [Burkholderia pseudomallei]EIF58304.1 hypothetical protein BP1258A_4038 [Burkholderia pseudomallei 1258a]EIF58745.1 hypothetical protein BP1258B_4446 [Burkholderia pseudomallei 1258b]
MRPCEPRNGMHVVRLIVGGASTGFQILRGVPKEWDRAVGRRGAGRMSNLDAGCRMPDAGCRMSDVRCRASGVGRRGRRSDVGRRTSKV